MTTKPAKTESATFTRRSRCRLPLTMVLAISHVSMPLVLSGCITVNVYFPAAAIEEAAEQIVDEVRPDIVDGSTAGQDSTDNDDAQRAQESGSDESDEAAAAESNANKRPSASPWFFARTLRIAATAALLVQAQSGSNRIRIDASSPKIKKIKSVLKKRYAKLLPLYKAGRVGEAHDGHLVVRDIKGVKLKEKRSILALVAAERKDRLSLYSAIADENKIDKKKVKDIGVLFAPSWQKKCKTGWWIEPKKGKWEKKKPPKKKKEPKKKA